MVNVNTVLTLMRALPVMSNVVGPLSDVQDAVVSYTSCLFHSSVLQLAVLLKTYSALAIGWKWMDFITRVADHCL